MKFKLLLGFALLLMAQLAIAQRALTGKVTDAETNEPLIGATVNVTGTTVGAATDASGIYRITVPADATSLTISYTGYERKVLPIGAGSELDVALNTSSILDEIVITGYAAEKKKDLLGAVAVLHVKDIENLANPNVLQSMQGRVAGVNVDQSGDPGQGTRVRVRGTSTLGKATDPLYIVDGVPIQSFVSNVNNSTIPQLWDLSWLNPNDIASVQVLKDASAASIYGSRAANGVVIITTKTAGNSQPRIEFNTRTSIENWNDFDNLTNSRERAMVEWQGAVNDGTNPDNTGIYKYKWHKDPSLGPGIQGDGVPVLDEIIYPEWLDEDDQMRPAGHPQSKYGGSIEEGTDYWKEISRMGVLQNYDLSFSQGNDRGGVRFGANYFTHKGVVLASNYKRMGIRMNSHFNFLDGKVTIGENFHASRGQKLLLDNGFGGTAENAPYRYKSILPVYTEDGRFSGPPGGGFSDRDNPVALAKDNEDDDVNNTKIIGNVYTDIKILPSLTLHSSFGLDHDNINSRDIFHTYSRGFLSNKVAELTLGQTRQTNWVFSNTLNFTKKFGPHALTLLGGTEAIKNQVALQTATAKEFALESVEYMQLSAASGERSNTGFSTGFSLFSYFGRINYDFSEKYLATFTVRRDGSSRFGTGNRFAIFPAVSLGWRISEEGFLKDNDFISNLKLRAAWGQSGNQDILNEARFGLYQAIYAPASNVLPWDGGCAQTPCGDAATSYDIGNNNTGILPSGFLATQTGNDNLRWETTTETNFGLDFEVLNDKLSGTLELFQRKTDDILVVQRPIAAAGDGADYWENGASMETKGWELSLDWHPLKRGNFGYNIGAVLSNYNSKITKLPESLIANYPNNANLNILGHHPDALFGYRTDGIFQNQAEVDAHAEQTGKGVGELRFVDSNGDGKIDPLDQEFGPARNVPKIEFGINTGLNWKAFDAQIFLFGNLGRKVTPDVYRMELGSLDNGENGGVAQLDAWSPTNTGSYIPAASNGSNRPFGFSLDYNVRNGNFLVIRQAQVGYTFPRSIIGRKISSLRMYVSGENLKYFVDRKGSNQFPHAGWWVENRVGGNYPRPQRFSLGISAGF